jgi:hypothetical protein
MANQLQVDVPFKSLLNEVSEVAFLMGLRWHVNDGSRQQSDIY